MSGRTSYKNIFQISVAVVIIVIHSCKKDEPPFLTTTEINNISSSSANSGGNITDDNGSPVTARGICWSTAKSPTLSDNITVDSTGTGSFVSHITGLTAVTEYFVRAYATNGKGTAYGNEVIFTTLEASLPEITTKDVTFKFVERSELCLTPICFTGGTITSDGGIPITSCGVCWSTNQSPTIMDKKTSDSIGIISYSSEIRDFIKGKTYYFRAYATNNIGTGYGNQVSFTIPCDWPSFTFYCSPDYGTTVNAMNLTLHFGLETIGPFGGMGWYIYPYSPLIYDVYLDTSLDPTKKIATNLSSNSLFVSGLNFATTYYWKVVGWESYSPCNSRTSSIMYFTTAPNIKTPSLSTTPVTIYTNYSATIGGNVNGDGGAPVTESGVYWGTSQNPESTGTKLLIGNGTGSFSTSLSGLNQNTIYYVKAYATNSAGTAYGSQVRFDLTNGSERVTDIEGNIYNIVTIGNLVWMAENLKTTRFADGTPIPLVNTSATWSALDLTSKAYCWYDDNINNKDIYGALYTWSAAMNGSPGSYTTPSGVQGVCPTGWHLPSLEEWLELDTYLGFSSANKMKETGYSHWEYPNTLATNESGFSGLPGGFRSSYDGEFLDIFIRTQWWSSDVLSSSSSNAGIVSLFNDTFLGGGGCITVYRPMKDGLSVRCIKDY